MHLNIILDEGKQFCYLIKYSLEVWMIERYLSPTLRIVNISFILVSLHYDIRGGTEHQHHHVKVEFPLLGSLLSFNIRINKISSISFDELLILIISQSHFLINILIININSKIS
jgi:hypothetical protein